LSNYYIHCEILFILFRLLTQYVPLQNPNYFLISLNFQIVPKYKNCKIQILLSDSIVHGFFFSPANNELIPRRC